MAKKQKINRKALIQMAVLLVVVFAAIGWMFSEEIRQSFSAKTVSKGVVIHKNKFNDKPHIGRGEGFNTNTQYRVKVELEGNAGRVTAYKEDVYNKAELNQTYYVLWRNYDNEILDIAADEASLNLDAGDDLSVWELLITVGITLTALVFIFLWQTKAKRK